MAVTESWYQDLQFFFDNLLLAIIPSIDGFHGDTFFISRANASTGEAQQPNGGELEDCTIIDLKDQYSMNQWNDVPCSLGDVKQYICKLSMLLKSKCFPAIIKGI